MRSVDENGKLKTSEGDLLPWNTVSGEFEDDIDEETGRLSGDINLEDIYLHDGIHLYWPLQEDAILDMAEVCVTSKSCDERAVFSTEEYAGF